MTLPSIGDVVDNKFRIERKLGEGGTSTIYEVRHLITEKKFAIKWLAPQLAQNDLAVQLLFHEAKVSGRFVHPNAVQIYDVCRSADSYYLLMEFLEGETLETRLHREQRLSVEAACDILLPCIEALSAAHRAGIVHRDLKPSNIFLCRIDDQDEVVPKVLDFGISNYVHGGMDISPTGSGTPLYMAPEQIWAQPADPKFDIYALGVVLYELVSGKPPFDSDDFDDLVHMIVESSATRLDQVVEVESEFAEIVARAMARGSDERFATMAELAAALRPYSSRQPRAIANPAPATRAEARRSEEPPRRSSWTSTTLGFAIQHHPALANAKPADSTPPPASTTPPKATRSRPPSTFATPANAAQSSPAPAFATPAKTPHSSPPPVFATPANAPDRPSEPAAITANAREPSSEPSEPVLELADLAGLVIEPEADANAAPSDAERERSPSAQPAPARSSSALEAQPAAEPPRAGAPAIEPAVSTSAAPAELPPARSRSASPPPQAAPRFGVGAPPIVLPQPRAASARAAEPASWSDDGFESKTPWNVEDVPAGLPSHAQRRLGLIASLGGAALLTCYALVRVIEPSSTTDVAPARTGTPRVDAPPVSHAAAAPEPQPAPAPVEPVPPPQPTAAEQLAAASDETSQAVQPERRAAAARQRTAKRSAAASEKEERAAQSRSARDANLRRNPRHEDGAGDAKEFAIPSRRHTAADHEPRDRSASSEAAKGFSLPETGLSRGDF